MSSLFFPVEILECITSMVNTSQHMRLWQCGDRILNYKLKNGGLKRTSLCWSGSSWMPWPCWYFTTFDGLVDVEWDMSIGKSLCPTLEFHLLPKTLKRLHLACDDVFLLLRQQNVNMNDVLPILQSLHLSGSHLREENLKNLPSNLIELYVASLGEKLESSTIFGELPRNIQRLTLKFYIVDLSEHENDLPNELVSLDTSNISCNFNWFSKLPKSLKKLKMHVPSFKYETLPNGLEELSIETNMWVGIPKSLLLLQLPSTLKTLELGSLNFDATELISVLPKNLTRLSLQQRLSHSEVQQLPSSLTDLDVFVEATHPDILSFFNPEAIRTCLGSGEYGNNLKLFPLSTKLQRLVIPCINDDMCAMLPTCLRTLESYGGLITIKGASKLPKSLTSLLTYFEVFDDNDAMSYIGHIPTIELWTKSNTPSRKLNENWISSLLPSTSRVRMSVQQSSSEHINPHLTSLVIHGNLETNAKIIFDSLPKFINLNTLEILYCGGIEGDWLGLIPKTVTRLRIGTLSTHPTATELSKLPSALAYLDLKVGPGEIACNWNDEVFQTLPRSLQWFHMDGLLPNVTHRMSEYLPPNLQLSSLKYQKIPFDFLTPLERLYGKN